MRVITTTQSCILAHTHEASGFLNKSGDLNLRLVVNKQIALESRALCIINAPRLIYEENLCIQCERATLHERLSRNTTTMPEPGPALRLF
jgi:hypothetical protein